MMSHQTVIVLDFGGQYNQLIARRVRECGVYCEVKPYTTPLEKLRAMEPIGFIFTGGPNSVYEAGAPKADPAIFELGVPVLGICYGCQFMAHTLGGQVTEAHEDTAREYGKTETYYDTACKLFKGLPERGISWMSHGDYMAKVPEGFALTAHSDACPNVAIADEKRGFYGVQYHPEVNHTEHGVDMIRNFLYEVCGAKGDWTMGDYKESSIKAIRVIGDLTKEKLDTLRDADAIYREEITAAGEDKNINQYFAVLTNTRSVGVMGDGRTYDYTLALRAVTTSDFMTADWARIPYDVLDKISTRIVNEVKGINRIVYDITSKPPATIEWE